MIKINFANAGQPAVNDTNLNQMQDNIETAINGAVSGDTLPIGSQIPYGNALAPSNWLICDGSVVSRIEYSELFSVIGTSYGVGDGSTTFNLPDKRKRTSVGLDTSDTDFNAIGKKLGEKEHTLTVTELPNYDLKGLKWQNEYPITLDSSTSGNGYKLYYDIASYSPSQVDAMRMNSGGSDEPHNNMQPSEVDNWIIKAKQSVGMVATVVDNLTSTSETDALSAKQGKVLNEKIEQRIVTGQEFATNEYIDGNRVYGKRMNLGTGTSAGVRKGYDLTEFGISNTTIKYVRHQCINITANVPLPILIGDAYDTNCWFNGSLTNFQIKNGASTENATDTIVLTLYYTKNS